MNGDAAIGRAQFQQVVTVRDDMDQRDRFFVEFVASGLDAREVEDFVDEIEQVHAGIMDVGGIVLVDRNGVGAKNFALHHFREAENGIERSAQLVAHLREEARLRHVGGFGTVAGFVRDRLGLLEFADQGVLFGAGFQRRQRGRMQAMCEQGEVAFRGDGQRREHVIIECATQQEVHGDGGRDRNGRREGRDRQAGRQHAGDGDHQQHHKQHQGIGNHVDP